jgi:putative Holliday junction resolvase
VAAKAVIAIDPGTKRTGFAVADALRISCEPLETYAGDVTGDALFAHIDTFLDDRDVEAFVIGLPLNMDGSEGERAKAVRELAARLAARYPAVSIALQDERLSSKAAEELLRESGHHKWQDRRGKRDAMSALVILRDWIEAGEPSS